MTLTRNEIETIVWSMLQDYITNDYCFEANQTKVVKKLLRQLDMNGIYLICDIENGYDLPKGKNFNRFIN